jgi:hypothetical protein
VCRRIRNGEIAPLPSTVSAECQDLISTMLTIDPAHRATVRAPHLVASDFPMPLPAVRIAMTEYLGVLYADGCSAGTPLGCR